MLSQIIGDVIFILLLIAANGFFVAAEFAIVKVRSSQMDYKVKKGHQRAILAKHIVEHLDSYLSATQLGITLTSLGLGWLGEPLLAELFRGPLESAGFMSAQTIHVVSFIVSFAILTFSTIVLGELGPKYMAIQHSEATALVVSIPLQLFFRVFEPFIWILNKTSLFLLGYIGITPSLINRRVHSPEELEIIFSEGAKSGFFNKTEQELISSIFEFSTTTAREIMVPRMEVAALRFDTTRENLIRIVTEEGYSRMPVYKDSIDNIVGVIYTKDLISLLEHRDLIVLQDIIRPPYFVPDAIKISQLMRDMQEKKVHIAIVIDEFGGTQGIITMEDILEEIVGEIHDEYDEVLKDVEASADGSALVSARMTIERFNKKFGVEIPEDSQYETLNGFLLKLTGRLPEASEVIRYGNLIFTVAKRGQRRIRQVQIKRTQEAVPGTP
jgi:CBS domain containing-hemolysin-like protein